MAYADASDIKARKDVRTLGDLVGDADTRATSVELDTDTVLATALQDASGIIDAAVFHAGRYSADDLNGLTGNSLALLKRLTCDIAYTLLRRRRGYTGDEGEDLAEFKQADQMLERLRKGERVFDVAEVIDAGNTQVVTITPTIVAQQNTVVSVADRYFPTRPYPTY